MQEDQNPESDIVQTKQKQTIEDYINQNLQLKTLKIKKFSFEQSLSSEAKSFKRLRSSLTTRQPINLNPERYIQSSNQWEPKLSHRKIVRQPKILLSVERRKIKTSQNIRKANEFFANPPTRQGFRGQKVRSHSFFRQKSQEKIPKRLIIESNNKSFSMKKYKYVPNFPFNLKYIKDQRKKQQKQKPLHEQKKMGSSKGYFAFFGSQNFNKYLESNLSLKLENLVSPSFQQINKAQQRKIKAKKKEQIKQSIRK